jgi:hypothetical protein
MIAYRLLRSQTNHISMHGRVGISLTHSMLELLIVTIRTEILHVPEEADATLSASVDPTSQGQAGERANPVHPRLRHQHGARPGVEVVLDSSGRVVKLRKSRGGPIPEDGSVLSGTGEAADWLLAHARPGRTINFTMSITAYGAPLAPGVSYAACA